MVFTQNFSNVLAQSLDEGCAVPVQLLLQVNGGYCERIAYPAAFERGICKAFENHQFYPDARRKML